MYGAPPPRTTCDTPLDLGFCFHDLFPMTAHLECVALFSPVPR